jgi:hypothetical protein
MSTNPIITTIHPLRVSPSCNSIPDVTPVTTNDDLTEVEDGDDEERNDGHGVDTKGGVPISSFSLQGLSFFPQQLAAKVDWITQCHNPFELLQGLGCPPSDSGEPSRDQPPSSLLRSISVDEDSYTVPTTYIAFRLPHHCEYCGSPSTDKCGFYAPSPTTTIPTTTDLAISRQFCQRPPTYFPKLRPPFSKKGKRWNSVTEYENPLEQWKPTSKRCL